MNQLIMQVLSQMSLRLLGLMDTETHFLKLMPTAVSAKPPYSSTIIAWEKDYYLERAMVELANNSIKNACYHFLSTPGPSTILKDML